MGPSSPVNGGQEGSLFEENESKLTLSGYTAAIGEGILFPDEEIKAPTKKSVIRLSQDNVKVLHEGKDERGGLDEDLVNQLVDIMSASITEIKDENIKGENIEEVIEKLKHIAHHIIDNMHRYKNIEQDKYVRINQSPSLTYTKNGRVAVSLKKLGKLIGKGTFKLAKFAIILKVSDEELSVKKGVSATMTPLTPTNRLGAQNERNMMLKLKELGKHPNIITCYSVTEYKKKNSENPKICLMLEYCDGGNLKDHLVSKDEISHIIEGTLNGLVFLHRNNIFHSDIKPANIFLTRGDQLEPKIADFGCSRDLNDLLQRTYFLGDRSYFSPELIKLEEKMLKKIHPFLLDEIKESEAAEQNYQEALKVFEKAKKTKEEKSDINEQKSKYSGFFDQKDVDLAQNEFDEAQNYFLETAEVLQFATEAKDKAEKKFNQKRDILVQKFQQEISPIDERILKSDIYAAGKTFKYVIRNAMNLITPEMKSFLEELTHLNLHQRPSAEEALRSFLFLRENNKIFLPDEEVMSEHAQILLQELENLSDEEIEKPDLNDYGLPKDGHY